MFSCKDDDSPLDAGNTPQGVNVTFDYSQARLSRSAGSSATLNGSSDVDWAIEVEEGDFFSVEPMSGIAGDFTLTVTANKDNTSTDKVYSKFILMPPVGNILLQLFIWKMIFVWNLPMRLKQYLVLLRMVHCCLLI